MGLEAKGDEGISTVTRARRTEQMATKKGDTVDLKGGTGKTSGVRTPLRTAVENSLIWGESGTCGQSGWVWVCHKGRPKKET